MKIPIKDLFQNKQNGFNTYIFVDLDNTSWSNIGVLETLNNKTKILFYADEAHAGMLENKNMMKCIAETSACIEKIKTSTHDNSVDFRIVSDMSAILTDFSVEYVYIISGDKGYDEVIQHLQEIYRGRARAIERFSSISDCMLDLHFMKGSSKEALKKILFDQFSRNYRVDAVNRILEMVD